MIKIKPKTMKIIGNFVFNPAVLPPTTALNKYAVTSFAPPTWESREYAMQRLILRRNEQKKLLSENPNIKLMDEGSLLGSLYEENEEFDYILKTPEERMKMIEMWDARDAKIAKEKKEQEDRSLDQSKATNVESDKLETKSKVNLTKEPSSASEPNSLLIPEYEQSLNNQKHLAVDTLEEIVLVFDKVPITEEVLKENQQPTVVDILTECSRIAEDKQMPTNEQNIFTDMLKENQGQFTVDTLEEISIALDEITLRASETECLIGRSTEYHPVSC